MNSKDRHLTLKVCTSDRRESNEIAACDHLKVHGAAHPGKQAVRLALDFFNAVAPDGSHHQCLLYHPLGMSYTEFLKLFPDKELPEDLLQRTMQLLLLGLEYLHQSNVVHTGMLHLVLSG